MSVRIKIPTVTLEDKWSSTPLRRNRFTAKHLRLAVIFAFVISLIINIYYFTRPQIQETPRPYIQPKGANARNRPSPDSIASREHDFDHGSLTNLVVVPGHAIYLGNQGRPMDNAEWSLKSFQKHDIKSIMAHIKRGIQVANDDKKSLLIFSG
ncbi:hypothetical protein H4219_000847 [Mycoemilia scoparia]|uniref:Uncharacterized protein n=1 Tax=Mycoemilia scoparia TaxID=417184 RepID=A0A9W8A8C5_9FUNG|nr:hypothetical protein H4219_000847 [Mycoemilia scoparia]